MYTKLSYFRTNRLTKFQFWKLFVTKRGKSDFWETNQKKSTKNVCFACEISLYSIFSILSYKVLRVSRTYIKNTVKSNFACETHVFLWTFFCSYTKNHFYPLFVTKSFQKRNFVKRLVLKYGSFVYAFLARQIYFYIENILSDVNSKSL